MFFCIDCFVQYCFLHSTTTCNIRIRFVTLIRFQAALILLHFIWSKLFFFAQLKRLFSEFELQIVHFLNCCNQQTLFHCKGILHNCLIIVFFAEWGCKVSQSCNSKICRDMSYDTAPEMQVSSHLPFCSPYFCLSLITGLSVGGSSRTCRHAPKHSPGSD